MVHENFTPHNGNTTTMEFLLSSLSAKATKSYSIAHRKSVAFTGTFKQNY